MVRQLLSCITTFFFLHKNDKMEKRMIGGKEREIKKYIDRSEGYREIKSFL